MVSPFPFYNFNLHFPQISHIIGKQLDTFQLPPFSGNKYSKTPYEPNQMSDGKMDGDHSAKSFEYGANSAMKGGYDMTEGIHESVNQTVWPPALSLRPDRISMFHSPFLFLPLSASSSFLVLQVPFTHPSSANITPARSRRKDHRSRHKHVRQVRNRWEAVHSRGSNWRDGAESWGPLGQGRHDWQALQCGWSHWGNGAEFG